MEADSLPNYQIIKTIDFCYGHRLLNYEGKCRHLHGHNGRVEIILAAEQLDERGMAYDFLEIKTKIKTWIDQNLDHKMLLNESDPLILILKEAKEPIFLLSGNPTAENIAKLIFEETKRLGLPVIEVKLWETPDSCAVYHGG